MSVNQQHKPFDANRFNSKIGPSFHVKASKRIDVVIDQPLVAPWSVSDDDGSSWFDYKSKASDAGKASASGKASTKGRSTKLSSSGGASVMPGSVAPTSPKAITTVPSVSVKGIPPKSRSPTINLELSQSIGPQGSGTRSPLRGASVTPSNLMNSIMHASVSSLDTKSLAFMMDIPRPKSPLYYTNLEYSEDSLEHVVHNSNSIDKPEAVGFKGGKFTKSVSLPSLGLCPQSSSSHNTFTQIQLQQQMYHRDQFRSFVQQNKNINHLSSRNQFTSLGVMKRDDGAINDEISDGEDSVQTATSTDRRERKMFILGQTGLASSEASSIQVTEGLMGTGTGTPYHPVAGAVPMKNVPYQIHNRVLGSKFDGGSPPKLRTDSTDYSQGRVDELSLVKTGPWDDPRRIQQQQLQQQQQLTQPFGQQTAPRVAPVSMPAQSSAPTSFQVHKRVMGWKLTSLRRRKELVALLDVINSDDNGTKLQRALEESGVLNHRRRDVDGGEDDDGWGLPEKKPLSPAEKEKRVKAHRRMVESWEKNVSRVVQARLDSSEGRVLFQKRKEERMKQQEARRQQILQRQNSSPQFGQNSLQQQQEQQRQYPPYEENNITPRTFSSSAAGSSGDNLSNTNVPPGVVKAMPSLGSSIRLDSRLSTHIRALSPTVLDRPVSAGPRGAASTGKGASSTTELLAFNDRMDILKAAEVIKKSINPLSPIRSSALQLEAQYIQQHGPRALSPYKVSHLSKTYDATESQRALETVASGPFQHLLRQQQVHQQHLNDIQGGQMSGSLATQRYSPTSFMKIVGDDDNRSVASISSQLPLLLSTAIGGSPGQNLYTVSVPSMEPAEMEPFLNRIHSASLASMAADSVLFTSPFTAPPPDTIEPSFTALPSDRSADSLQPVEVVSRPITGERPDGARSLTADQHGESSRPSTREASSSSAGISDEKNRPEEARRPSIRLEVNVPVPGSSLEDT